MVQHQSKPKRKRSIRKNNQKKQSNKRKTTKNTIRRMGRHTKNNNNKITKNKKKNEEMIIMRQKLILTIKTRKNQLDDWLTKQRELIKKFRIVTNISTQRQLRILKKLIKGRTQNKLKTRHKTLAKLLNISTTTIARLMSWNYATPYMKDCVKRDLLSLNKAMRIIHACSLTRVNEKEANEAFYKCLTLTTFEIQRLGRKIISKQVISLKDIEKTYGWVYHIKRDIQVSYSKIQRNLLSYSSIPDSHKVSLKNLLEKHKVLINNYLKILKKEGF